MKWTTNRNKLPIGFGDVLLAIRRADGGISHEIGFFDFFMAKWEYPSKSDETKVVAWCAIEVIHEPDLGEWNTLARVSEHFAHLVDCYKLTGEPAPELVLDKMREFGVLQ